MLNIFIGIATIFFAFLLVRILLATDTEHRNNMGIRNYYRPPKYILFPYENKKESDEMKNITILVDGKEIQAQVGEEQLKQLCEKKRTGYEIVPEGKQYWFDSGMFLGLGSFIDNRSSSDVLNYGDANYYSNRTVAENNARADKLMRQLRRFAVENRKSDIDWTKTKYDIFYNYDTQKLCVGSIWRTRGFGNIYFDGIKTAEQAIDQFKDELLWYFTEYKDSL